MNQDPDRSLSSRAAKSSIVRGDARWSALAPWIATGFVALWVAVFSGTSSAQWGDHLEQFVWAHSYEWGYHKHPPLPTWLLAAAIDFTGPSRWWALILGASCTAATGWLTYRIAQRILGDPWAALALLVWGLQQAFSARASLFNHNTVMMLATAATVWSVLRALQTRRRAAWWLLSGACAGAALLSKYQAVVPLAGVLVALWWSGELRDPCVRRGVLVASLAAALALVPHAGWMAMHDFSTLAYAQQQGSTLGWPERGASVIGFAAQQLRLLAPALLFAAALWVAVGERPGPAAAAEGSASTSWRTAWLIGLIAFPLAATVLTAPLLGLKLQNHWGYQCLQFAGLLIAHLLRDRVPRSQAAWLALAVAAHGAFLAIDFASPRPAPAPALHRIDAHYPAERLAATIQRQWRDSTACPLRIVVGPSFEAGLVSVYSGGTARVLEDGDFGKSPWISAEDVERDGAVYVGTALNALPTRRATVLDSLDVGHVSPAPADRIYWAIVPPASCPSAPNGGREPEPSGSAG